MNDACTRMIRNIESLGTAPVITLRILQEVKKENADFAAIARIIMEDPRITAQVLKVANSPVFAGITPVDTVSKAVISLGSQNIQQIIFAIELFGTFRGEGIRGKFNEETFWKHSLAGAMIVEELCLSDKGIDRETAYIAALLRNFGVLAIRQYLSDEFETINALIEANTLDFITSCQMIIGESHKNISFLIAKQWKLPQKIVAALGENHTHETVEEISKIRAIIETADAMLCAQKYCLWDGYYKLDVEVDNEISEAVCNNVFPKVEEVFEKLWM